MSVPSTSIRVSYHNHTGWSDGEGDVTAYLQSGQAAGLEEVGISDHLTLAPAGATVSWSMPPERFPAYVASLQRAAASTADVTLRIGVEADFFPETAAAVTNLLATAPLDYVIGSVHFFDDFPIDECAEHWDALTPAGRDAMWRGYWQRSEQLAESELCDVIGHLDLPKKFGHRPRADMRLYENRVLDAIAGAGVAIEINTNGWNKPVQEAYPSLDLLRRARARGIPLLISADAHEPGAVAQHFERARLLAQQAGYTEFVRFVQRKRSTYPV
ncbi:MAG: histidinol-phosphatase HisJ family protein [Chloroflexi bacterium]|nr:histidinol-phosphatase HisJ family protein [Chloroflexota bacterium]